MKFQILANLLGALALPAVIDAQAALEIGTPGVRPTSIGSTVLHPPYREVYFCGEHNASEFFGLGDALGSDCLAAQPLPGGGPDAPYVVYRGAGLKNEDWFGWGKTVFAPVDAVVEDVYVSSTTNQVGRAGRSEPPSMILFVGDDGLRVLYAHLGQIDVAVGERVRRGQPVGTVGNNGLARNPHLHIGAWRDRTPLQVRFDQTVSRGSEAP